MLLNMRLRMQPRSFTLTKWPEFLQNASGNPIRRYPRVLSCICAFLCYCDGCLKSSALRVGVKTSYTVGGEPIYCHGPHELCIIAGGPQNQLILSSNSTFIQL